MITLLDIARAQNERLRTKGIAWRFRDGTRNRVLRIAEMQLELFPLKLLKRKRKRRWPKPQVIL